MCKNSTWLRTVGRTNFYRVVVSILWYINERLRSVAALEATACRLPPKELEQNMKVQRRHMCESRLLEQATDSGRLKNAVR